MEQIVNFLLVYEAILFSFWNSPKWSVETPEGTLDGSTALLYALLKYVKNYAKSNHYTDLRLTVDEGNDAPRHDMRKLVLELEI